MILRAARAFIVGDEKLGVTRKFVGDPSLIDRALVSLATSRGLLLVGVPKDYDERYFWLVQGDNISFGDLRNVDNRRKNFYTKVAYQYGTQFDERLNGIVGESRGRITPVLTAFRDIGPQRSSYAVALTQTFNVTGGDLDLELEGLEHGRALRIREHLLPRGTSDAV